MFTPLPRNIYIVPASSLNKSKKIYKINKHHTTITDKTKKYNLTENKKYILKCTTGKVTLKAFKEIISKDTYEFIIFEVFNYEKFFIDFNFFRNMNFIDMTGHNEEVDVFGKELCEYEMLDSLLGKRKDEYLKMDKVLRKKFKIAAPASLKREIELSFYPKMFDSVKTSLKHPDKYMSEENPSTLIYKALLEGKKKYEELKVDNLDVHLKSLLFYSIIGNKNGYFYIK